MSCLCLPPSPSPSAHPSLPPSPLRLSLRLKCYNRTESFRREKKGCRSRRVEFSLELGMLHKLSLCVTGGGGAEGGETEVKERDGEREKRWDCDNGEEEDGRRTFLVRRLDLIAEVMKLLSLVKTLDNVAANTWNSLFLKKSKRKEKGSPGFNFAQMTNVEWGGLEAECNLAFVCNLKKFSLNLSLKCVQWSFNLPPSVRTELKWDQQVWHVNCKPLL